jgi:hypothetical protein
VSLDEWDPSHLVYTIERVKITHVAAAMSCSDTSRAMLACHVLGPRDAVNTENMSGVARCPKQNDDSRERGGCVMEV